MSWCRLQLRSSDSGGTRATLARALSRSASKLFSSLCLASFFLPSILFFASLLLSVIARAEVSSVTLQSPALQNSGTTNLTSPIHLLATAEDTATIKGYNVYVDGHNVFSNSLPVADAWIGIPAGLHALYVEVQDEQSGRTTSTYQINVTGFAPPTAPPYAKRILNVDNGQWTVDNNPAVGGSCNHGSLGSFRSSADPNTENAPALGAGQHFIVASGCEYDDSLFYRKYSSEQERFAASTNFLWDFWFYIPSRTKSSSIQALEFDLFQALQLSDGVHEFMFGSQCNYAVNQWQFWLPGQSENLTWVSAGQLPCNFSTGEWHHATYFMQRVTPSGYQTIPQTFSPSSDKNTSLRFGTVTIDGETVYVGGVAWSTIPNPGWSPVIGMQHQLDSAVAGVVIEEYSDRESLTMW